MTMNRAVVPNLVNMQGVQQQGYDLSQLDPEAALEAQNINRRQQIANLLIQQGMQPAQGQMVGRFYVKPDIAQGISQLGSALAGAGLTWKDAKDQKELAQGQKAAYAKAIEDYKQGIAPTETPTATETAPSNLEPIIKALQPNAVPTMNPMQAGPRLQTGMPPESFGASNPAFSPQELTQAATTPGAMPQLPNGEDASVMSLAGNPAPTPPEPYQPAQFQRGMESTPKTPEQIQAAQLELLGNQSPQARRLGQFLMQQTGQQQEKTANRDFLKGENALNRETQLTLANGKIDQMMTLGLITQATGKQMKELLIEANKQMAADRNATSIEVAHIAADAKRDTAGATTAKKGEMPPAALKMKTEALDAIGSASALNADLSAIHDQVASGKIDLGPMKNLMATGKNLLGMSDEQSRNYATFKATLEKQRNESLRLNKGVQTEGDSVRAWNELIENINDPKVVSQRLKEIQALNERAVGLHKMNLDMIQKNYDLDPIDTSAYEQQPAAVGAGTLTPAEQAELDTLKKKYGR